MFHICIQNDISLHATAAISSFHCNEFNECFDLRTLSFNNNFHFHYFDTCEIKISRQYNKKVHLTIELHPRFNDHRKDFFSKYIVKSVFYGDLFAKTTMDWNSINTLANKMKFDPKIPSDFRNEKSLA